MLNTNQAAVTEELRRTYLTFLKAADAMQTAFNHYSRGDTANGRASLDYAARLAAKAETKRLAVDTACAVLDGQTKAPPDNLPPAA